MDKSHTSYQYAEGVISGSINAPKYVKLQCRQFLKMADGKDDKYMIDDEKVNLIDEILKLMIMPKGYKEGKNLYESLVGFQFFFIISVLCSVFKNDITRRRYRTAILEICRKNGKTFLVAVIFILLFFLEPKFSKFYSVAPDGSLSREIKQAIREIIESSPALIDKFKVRRDDIQCLLNENIYYPLNYSNNRMDGRQPSVFVADEVGALPNNYAVAAMRSGQLTVKNKLGCIISTKYPNTYNPFEEEVAYAKQVLDEIIEDDYLFALLYEPDDTKHWANNDDILIQSNPLAISEQEIMKDLILNREKAILLDSQRENFLTKHCNIIYQGVGTESYVDIKDLQKCKVDKIDWVGKNVFLGLDLSITNDNTSWSMVALDDMDNVLAESIAFIPADKIMEKSSQERIDYMEFIREKKCFPCGDRIIDYNFVEESILKIEQEYGVHVVGVGYDRYNCMSTAQKLEKTGMMTVEVKQHSSVLHPATKYLKEKIESGKFEYENNKLLEINFQNAKCTEDTNLNKYVNKKRSNGKVDMVVSLINAIYMLLQDQLSSPQMDWVIQVI